MPRVHCRCPAGAQTRCCSRTEQTMGNSPANADRRDCADISGTYLDRGSVALTTRMRQPATSARRITLDTSTIIGVSSEEANTTDPVI